MPEAATPSPALYCDEETEMSKSIKAFIAISLLTVAAACAQQSEEVIVVDPEPIMEEPTFNKM